MPERYPSGTMSVDAPLLHPEGQASGDVKSNDSTTSVFREDSFCEEKLVLTANGLGDTKEVDLFGGLALIFNNACGAGVAAIPLVFVQGGWAVATAVLLTATLASGLASTMLCEVMRSVPGNEQFRSRVEFTAAIRFFMGDRWEKFSHVLLFLALQSLNVASIVISAQAIDSGLADMVGRTCGLRATGSAPGWQCVGVSAAGHSSPFSPGCVLSAGYVLAAAVAVPFGLFNLEENIIVQKGAFILTLVCIGDWLRALAIEGPTWDFESMPPVAGGSNSPTAVITCLIAVMGSVVYNYAFVVTVPSWCNEKRPEVSVNFTVWWATVLVTVLYIVLGVMGAVAYGSKLTVSRDILACLNNSGLARFSVCIFPLMAALSGVPIFCIIIRYNLVQSGLCGRLSADFLGVYLPWLVALPMQTGSGLQQVINWTALLFGSIANFGLPFLLYVRYLQATRAGVDTSCYVRDWRSADRNAELVVISDLPELADAANEHTALWCTPFRWPQLAEQSDKNYNVLTRHFAVTAAMAFVLLVGSAGAAVGMLSSGASSS